MTVSRDELYRDELTGALNRRYFQEVLPEVFQEMCRLGLPITILVIDLDHFKAINDTYGHLEGDAVLKAFVALLRGSLRQSDRIIRYGGDEIVAVLLHTDQDTAWKIANRLLAAMQRQTFHGHHLTASIGMASFPTDGWNLHDLFARADQALYRAKNLGRSRVESAHVRTPTLEWPVSFVPRIQEERLLEQALKQEGRFIVVSGPAGIGKTRLLAEFLSHHQISFLRGNAYALFQGMSYAPFLEIIQTLLQEKPETLDQLDLPYRTAIQHFLERSEDSSASQSRLFEAVFRLLENSGIQRFMLDDIQWLDPSSTQLLYFLLRSGLRFVATLRLEENQRITQTFLHTLHREGWVEEVPVSPLSQEQIRVLLRRALHMDPGDSIVQTLHRLSGGNPYLLGETLRDLYRRGYLVFRHVWELRIPPTYTPPRSVETLTTYKLGLLSPDHQRLAEVAAVLGPQFTLEALSAVSQMPESQISLLLEDLLRVRIVEEIPGGFAFPEDVVREAILSKMSTLRRKTLHHRAARYAAQHGASADVLAYHHHHAGNRKEAFRALMQAIEEAQRVYAYPNALQLVTLALQDATTQEEQWEAKQKQAEILAFLGEYEQAAEILQELLKHPLEALGSRFGKVVVAWLRLLVAQGDHHKAVEEADEYLGQLHDPVERLKVQVEKAWALIQLGQHAAAQRILRKVRRAQPPNGLLAKILNLEAQIQEAWEHWKKAESLYQKALDLYRTLGDRRGEGVILTNLAGLYLNRHQLEKAQTFYQEALQLYESIGYLEGKVITLGDLGVVYSTMGYVDAAIQTLQQAVLLANRMNYQRILPSFYVHLAWAYAYKAEQERALGFVELALESAKEQNMPREVFFRILEKGYLFLLFGRKEEAWDVLEKASSWMDSSDVYQRFGQALVFLEWYLEEGNNPQNISSQVEILKKSMDTLRSHSLRFYGSLVLARASAFLGHPHDAHEYLNRARRILRRLQNPLMRGEYHLDRGKTLEMLKDTQKALRAYRQAQKIFENLGVELLLQEASRREEQMRASLG